jgi:hypothetical protein
MVFSKESIANFIYDLLKYQKVCKNDLDFAYNIFIKNEEYEKCSIIKELIDIKYYDNRKRSNNEEIQKVEQMIRTLSSGVMFLEKKEFIKQTLMISRLKSDIEKFYEMSLNGGKDIMILPPFKNEKNKYYFYNI